MSHYTVMVLTEDPSEEALGQALAPFDEDMQVEPYRDYHEGRPADHWAARSLREKGLLAIEDDQLTWEMVRQAVAIEYPGEEREIMIELEVDEDGGPTVELAYRMSTYNPNSKWDWWSIGGRWPERLLLLDGSRTSQCRRRDLDLESMRAQAGDQFRVRWGAAVEIASRVPHRPWSMIVDNYPPDMARSVYWDQESIRQLGESLPEEDRMWLQTEGETIDKVLVDQPEFDRQVELARAAAVPCFATLDLAGRWNEPGKMGWFGMSSDTEGTRIGYYEAMNGLIQNLDPEVWITVVDCHI